MAGDWIKWEKGFAHKPEVLRVATALGITRLHAASLIVEKVFEWTDSNVSFSSKERDADGQLYMGNDPIQLFDMHTETPGLGKALCDVGWMRVRGKSLVFLKFGRHNGVTAKARAGESVRKATSRKDQNHVPEMSGHLSGQSSGHVSGQKSDQSRAEQSREDKNCLKADMTPSEIMDALGVGDPTRAALLRIEGCTSALLCHEWARAGEGRPRDRRKVFIAAVKKALDATIPKAKSVTAELNRLNALIAQRTA